MKITRTASGKRKLTISKKEWVSIGKKQGWITSNKEPCWENYEMVGTKEKDGKKVPNCVPKKKDEVNTIGLADKENFKEKNADPKQLQMGIKIEMEHTEDPKLAKEIALDHLSEDPEYYTKLKKMEECKGCKAAAEILKKQAAEYKGKKVTLNKPFRTPKGPKKFSVYVKNEKGNVVKVNFGDPNMEIKRDDPERRKSFRARHNCDDPGPKWKARYWSCWQWRSNSKVQG